MAKPRAILFFLFVVVTQFCLSQRSFSKEFSFVSDNDLYFYFLQDRYYTNGIFLTYRYLGRSDKINIEKKIFEIQIGQKIYTPSTIVEPIPVEQHDRPFAGYLYSSFGINKFFSNATFLKTYLKVGVIGSDSFAEEVQNFIHNITGFKNTYGWKYQIKNALALNFAIKYAKNLKNKLNTIDFTWINQAKVGTVNTNISTGIFARIGLKPLQKLANSIAFNSNLNNSQTHYSNKAESFLYISSAVKYVVYDATIQGSFLNPGSPKTFSLIPLVFIAKLGVRFTYNRFNFGYALNYYSKKLKSIQASQGNIYASIQVNYQFN
ncbi:MAG: lipid A deacylase LpxR family protein [Tenacibaculum sp.]